MRTVIAVLLVAMTGCSGWKRPSAIVAKAEAAGAGDLSGASTGAMQAWLEQHRVVATEVNRMCTPVRKNAPADWVDTTEGRLCAAARNIVVSPFRPVESDHRVYESGWK
jgi:flagellar basal body rod protein FlgF